MCSEPEEGGQLFANSSVIVLAWVSGLVGDGVGVDCDA